MHDPPSAGPRLPRNHQLVHEVVLEHGRGRHLTTADVHALARRSQPAIGFTTVYRALNRLSGLGLVAEVRVPGAEVTYYESPAGSHAHFRCERCGRIDDVAYALSGEVVAELGRSHGVEVRDAQVTLSGRCGACREALAGR